MCETPNKLYDGTVVACHKCWQCVANRVNDWTGRCIAESQTATAAHAISLTYGRDEDGNVHHARSAVLTYSDVQGMFKRLRRNGYPLRYLVAGEYGTERGRAHWHLIAFWQKKVPPHVIGENCHIKEWPHGHTYWQPMEYKAVRYCVKYVVKDAEDAEAQSHFSLSKKPPLGAAYFDGLAQRYVDQGLAPRDLYYTFPHVTRKNGERTKFFMQGVTRDNFLAAFVRKWHEQRPDEYLPNSELVEEWQDKQAKAERETPDDTYKVPYVEAPRYGPDGKAKVFRTKRHGPFKSECDGQIWHWIAEEGKGRWQSEDERRAKDKWRQRPAE